MIISFLWWFFFLTFGGYALKVFYHFPPFSNLLNFSPSNIRSLFTMHGVTTTTPVLVSLSGNWELFTSLIFFRKAFITLKCCGFLYFQTYMYWLIFGLHACTCTCMYKTYQLYNRNYSCFSDTVCTQCTVQQYYNIIRLIHIGTRNSFTFAMIKSPLIKHTGLYWFSIQYTIICLCILNLIKNSFYTTLNCFMWHNNH